MASLHSLIIDDVLTRPEAMRAHALTLDYKGEVGPDGVTYPNISSSVPEEHLRDLYLTIESAISAVPDVKLPPFLRLSLADTVAPHWAHTDAIISDFLALLYLTAPEHCQGGTHLVEHVSGMRTHPADEAGRAVWARDTNDRSKWTITWTAPMRFNRLVVLPTQLFHAASLGFGTSAADGRLVLITFFS